MKKTLGIVLLVILILFTSCANKGQSTKNSTSFNLENEIVTYENIQPEKEVFVIAKTGNVYFTESIYSDFIKTHPEVQLVFTDITYGGKTNYPVKDVLDKGERPDVIVWATSPDSILNPEDYFEDLSTNSALSRFSNEALNTVAVDGKVYYLPGPGIGNAFLYNKTMFEKYGWSKPKNFDEFVELCVQIKKDTNGEVTPFNPNMKYPNVYVQDFEGFVYNELFGGVENLKWYKDYLAGKATFSSHMKPFYDAYQKLVDAELIDPSFFSYSTTTRWKEFLSGKIAMVNYVLVSGLIKMDDRESEIDTMGFPSTSEGYPDGALKISYGTYFSVPKKENNAKRKAIINDLIAYWAKDDVQKQLMGKNVMVSSLKGNSIISDNAIANESLKNLIEQGNSFSGYYFKTHTMPSTYNPFAEISAGFKEILNGTIDSTEAMRRVDEKHQEVLSGKYNEEVETVATSEKDFTVLETSMLLSDMFKEKTGSDIALVINNNNYRGNLMRIFKGSITPDMITNLKPRSFDNKSKLQRVVLTGENLIKALNTVLVKSGADMGMSYKPIYASSGLKCEVKPTAPLGEKYISITLMDGSAIIPDKEYTVGAWQGTIDDQFISRVEDEIEGSFESLLTEYLKAKGTITPYSDDRIKLNWK